MPRILPLLPLPLLVGLCAAQQHLFNLAVDPVNAFHGVQIDVGGDFDGDGSRDSVVFERGDEPAGAQRIQVVRVLSGTDGHQILQRGRSPGALLWSGAAAVPDLSGDFVPDVAVSTGFGIEVYSGATGGLVRTFGSGLCLSVLGASDLNSDSIPDVVGWFSASPNSLLQAFSGATGALLWSAVDVYRPRLVGDVTADGAVDVLTMRSQGLRLVSGATGQTVWIRAYPSNPSRQLAGIGDTNFDGVPDVAVSSPVLCNGGSCQGVVEILAGQSGQVLQVITKGDPHSEFGSELAAAGDILGTGRGGFLASTHSSPGRLFGFTGAGAEVFAISDSYVGSLVGGFDLGNDGIPEFAYWTLGPSTASIKVMSMTRASYQSFGSGCAGSVGVPVLAHVTLPRIGTQFGLQVAGLRPFQLGFVYTGFSDQVWTFANQPLPFPLAPLGLPGCTLYVDPLIDGVTHSGGGTASWGFQVPSSSVLYGLRFFNQAVFFDPWSAAGVVVSNAGAGVMGS